jgi:hypothetical protein
MLSIKKVTSLPVYENLSHFVHDTNRAFSKAGYMVRDGMEPQEILNFLFQAQKEIEEDCRENSAHYRKVAEFVKQKDENGFIEYIKQRRRDWYKKNFGKDFPIETIWDANLENYHRKTFKEYELW